MKTKQTLRIDDMVRLAVPHHIVWGRGWEHANEGSIVMDRHTRAHVMRENFPSKTICGRNVGEYWRWQVDPQTVASLREVWEAKAERLLLDFEGTRLDICEYCCELVVYGRRFRHAAKEYWVKHDDDAPFGLDIKIVTRRAGLDQAEDLCPKCGHQLGSDYCENATAAMTDGHTDSYESLKVTGRRLRDLLWTDGWKPEEMEQIEELRKRVDESITSIENGEADYAEAKARYEAARTLGQDHW